MRYLTEPPPSAELIVIGGGVAGAATAFHAARAGLKPIILEARAALCTLTTPVAAGAFRLQFDNRTEWELVRESVDMFLNFAEATGQDRYGLGVRQAGYLWMTTDPANAERQRELVARQHQWGQRDVQVLGGDEVRRQFPFAGPDVIQARFRAGDGFLDTKQLTFGLAHGSHAGVVLSCRATGFRVSGGRLEAVTTDRGDIATDTAVIAAGPFTRDVAAAARVEMPIVTVRRQKVVMPSVPQVPVWAPMTIDDDTGVHWRPAQAGAWLLYTDPSTPESAPSENVPTDGAFAFRLLDPSSPVAAARTVPFWRDVWEDGSAHWMLQAGQYALAPDHLPLIGSTGLNGLWVNSAYGGHGIMESPAGSALVVRLITGTREPPVNPFRPDRVFEKRQPPAL